METLLTDVLDRLKDKVPALKYFDEDWGQLDYYYPHPPVKWPCVLVDATDANWSDEGRKIQTGLIQVKIRLADLRLNNTSGNAPQGQKDKAFAIFTIQKEIYKALHGWTGSRHYSSLKRVRMGRVKREDGVRIYETIFTTQLKDASAADQLATAPATLVITT